jgi:excisionase family DNA binding protein
MNEIKELLTVDEIARKLNISVSWIYSNARRKGNNSIPHLKIGKYIRFQEDVVRQWLDNQQRNKANLE